MQSSNSEKQKTYSLAALLRENPLWRGLSVDGSSKKQLPQVYLSREMTRKLRQGEFWIYRQQIKNFDELTSILPQGGFVRLPAGGLALFDSQNPIALRALDMQNRQSDAKPYVKKAVMRAIEIRRRFFPFLRSQNLQEQTQKKNPKSKKENALTTNGIRLLHGENDFLAGLTADLYKNLLVYRPDTLAWFAYLKDIDKIFREQLAIENSYVTSRYAKGWLAVQETPAPESYCFQENGFALYVQPGLGQKTGFFLDMRSNRAFIENISYGKNVLNAFSYTCAFSLYALRGGASSVLNIDISAEALQAGKENHRLNGLPLEHQQAKFLCDDVIAWLKGRNAESEKLNFDLIILDPPSYAHTQDKVENALRAYKTLNKEALLLLRSGQYLATASCSARISYRDFFQQIVEAADESGRRVRLIYSQGADVDHPYAPNNVFEPYLKFLVFYVESD